ncbi:MAG: LptF/LptG family permease [Bacteroidaceae bacterium]|nr:LptF/LptG family permease [Bacteroidaceae bacterium]MBR6845186.1 LptF/LptG family permease [Bacteroidaceae bacterium]
MTQHTHFPTLRKLDWYIIKKFLGTYFFSIVLIISISVVFDFNENVDKFTTNNAPLHGIIYDYYLNFVQYYANLFSSLFVFISVIFFTSKLAENSEIIAMLAAGVSFRRLMVPYMFSACIIAGITYYLGTDVIPRGSVKRLAFENQYKRQLKVPTWADNVQLQVDTGVIAYMEHYDGPSHTGYHFSLDKFEHKKLVSHLTAMTAEYDTISDVRFKWTLRNVNIRELKGLREKITFINQIDSIIKLEPQDFLTTNKMQETMTSEQLEDYISRQRIRGTAGLQDFEVEYHKRIAAPFAAFILSIIGATLSSRKRKGGMGFALGLGLALSAIYILLQGICSSFSTQAGMAPWLAAWLPNIIYIPIAIALYKRAPR